MNEERIGGVDRPFRTVDGVVLGIEGSQAHQKASRAGAEGMKAKVWTDEGLDARAERSKRLGLRPPNRWNEAGEWT